MPKKKRGGTYFNFKKEHQTVHELLTKSEGRTFNVEGREAGNPGVKGGVKFSTHLKQKSCDKKRNAILPANLHSQQEKELCKNQ